MFLSLTYILFSIVSTVVAAPFGDIVQFWNTQAALAINASVPSLASAHAAYTMAYVHSSILLAATVSANETLPVQQLVVSFAAHDTLQSLFLPQYPTLDAAMKSVEDAIQPSPGQLSKSKHIGKKAALDFIRSRLGDGVIEFVRYDYKPPAAGVYQPTPPDFPAEPLAPSARFVRPFGNVGKTQKWPIPPPDPVQPGYATFLQEVMQKGVKVGSTRTPRETETAFLFLEGMSTFQNRYVSSIVGDKFQNNVLESARFYAMINHALADAGLVEYTTKYAYNSWRPVTAIHFNQTYLAGGQRLFDPNWSPVADTPTHPEYISGHAIFSSAVAGVLKRYFGSDKLDPPVTVSSNATANSNDNIGVLSRTYDSIDALVQDVGDARVFVGVHFRFACDEGIKAGDIVAQKVFDDFQAK